MICLACLCNLSVQKMVLGDTVHHADRQVCKSSQGVLYIHLCKDFLTVSGPCTIIAPSCTPSSCACCQMLCMICCEYRWSVYSNDPAWRGAPDSPGSAENQKHNANPFTPSAFLDPLGFSGITGMQHLVRGSTASSQSLKTTTGS